MCCRPIPCQRNHRIAHRRRPTSTARPAIPLRGAAPALSTAVQAHLSPPPMAKSPAKPSPIATATAPPPVGMSQMIFPPDQDVLVPMIRTRKPSRPSKKANLAVLASGVVVLIAASFLLWAVLRKRPSAESSAANHPSDSTTSDKANESDSPPKKSDEDHPAPDAGSKRRISVDRWRRRLPMPVHR